MKFLVLLSAIILFSCKHNDALAELSESEQAPVISEGSFGIPKLYVCNKWTEIFDLNYSVGRSSTSIVATNFPQPIKYGSIKKDPKPRAFMLNYQKEENGKYSYRDMVEFFLTSVSLINWFRGKSDIEPTFLGIPNQASTQSQEFVVIASIGNNYRSICFRDDRIFEKEDFDFTSKGLF